MLLVMSFLFLLFIIDKLKYVKYQQQIKTFHLRYIFWPGRSSGQQQSADEALRMISLSGGL